MLPDGETLGKILATKAPEKWMAFCDPERLMMVKGEEGTCVYTTFEVEGKPEVDWALDLDPWKVGGMEA